MYRPDGTLHLPSHADIIKPQSGESDLQERLDGVLTKLANAQTVIAALRNQVHHIGVQLNGERASRAIERKTTDDERESLKTRIQQLEARILKVSVEEWDRIKAVDEKVQAERASALKTQRLVSSCSCRGEVESCARCSGSGWYTTDGYGNLV